MKPFSTFQAESRTSTKPENLPNSNGRGSREKKVDLFGLVLDRTKWSLRLLQISGNPIGLTVVKEEDVREFLFPLKIRKIPGVGPKTERILKELNIETVRDLASADPKVLTRLSGAWGARLHEFANGIDYSEVTEEYETKSIRRDTTFEKDMDDQEKILQVLDAFTEEVHEDTIANGLKFKTITVRIRYEHFETHTRSKSLLFPTNDLNILRNKPSG